MPNSSFLWIIGFSRNPSALQPAPPNAVHSSILQFALLYALLALPSAGLAQNLGENFETLTTVEFVQLPQGSVPDQESNWQQFTLPIGGIGDGFDDNREMWFRFQLERNASHSMTSLYFYRYNHSINVFFNGEKIGGDSFREGRQTVSWNRPRLVDIQNANWKPGRNEVLVQFTPSYFGGTFAPILVGESEQLSRLYAERLFRQVKINEWLQVFGIFSTLLALVLWSVRKKDVVYLLFAGVAGCWSILTTHMVVYYNLLSYRFWLPLVHIAIDFWALCFYFFIARLIELEIRTSGRLLRAWTALALAWNLITPMEVFPHDLWWTGAYFFHLVGIGFISYILIRVVAVAVSTRQPLAMSICAALVVQIGFFLHDLYLVWFSTISDWQAMYYSQFAFPLIIAVFTVTLLERFTSALSLAEELNRDLEEKVERSSRIIEKTYAENRKLELRNVAENERINIYRDLHDDVGSKLLSIVHAGRVTSTDSRMEDLAKSALESLRNAVSRVNNPDQSLPDLLAELAEESALRLRGSNHRFQWRQPEQIPNVVVSSPLVFNLNRVFKEVVSNIIRHAQAGKVDISVSVEGELWCFEVRDDGCGFDPENQQGNGVQNIKSRAAEIGAEVQWNRSDSGGVIFKICLVLAPGT